VLNFSLVIVKKEGEGLNKVIICDFFSERLSKSGEVLSESKSNLPGFIFTSSQECTKCVNLIFFLRKIISHWDQGLETHDSNDILFILRKLSEDWKNLLKDVLLLKLSGKLSKFRSASSSNHRGIFITEFNKLLSELFFRIS